MVERNGRPLQGHYRYLPRLGSRAIRAGAHWDLIASQGANRTFWLGCSVWFDAVEHVLRYNRAVLS